MTDTEEAVTRLEMLTAERRECARRQAALDEAWVEEIIRQVDQRYSKVDIAARAGITRTRVYQILYANGFQAT